MARLFNQAKKKDENIKAQQIMIENYLEGISECSMGNFYWKDKDGYYLGCNKSTLTMSSTGAKQEVIGKTDYDLWPGQADELRKNDIAVMESGKLLSFEETININNMARHYAVIKVPLRNYKGEIIGIIGNSLDTTHIKEAENLKAQLKEQEKVKIFVEQMAHDIRSPLVVLSMLVGNCQGLSERDYITLRNVIANIENIADNLLSYYKEKEDDPISLDKNLDKYVSLSWGLQDVIENKKYQYKKSKITFKYLSDPANNFKFIEGDYSDFFRMMSNLLSNAIDAIEGREGIIEVGFTIKDRNVEIYIKDNGKGMPTEIVDKIMKDIQVSEKQGGYGIGMRQVKRTLQAMNGEMLIKSKKNVGTEIVLTFCECDPPKWFPKELVFHKGDTVVVLDDDPSIHDIWKRRFENYLDKIVVKYFTDGLKAIDFINSLKERNKVLLLADYELRGQRVNGLDVIEKSGMQKQSVIVTTAYVSKIKGFNERADFIKLIPKPYMNETPILFKDEERTGIADLVFIDDNESFTGVFIDFLKARGLKADAYNSSDNFLNNLQKYSKDTKIVADHELKQGGNGFDLLEKLHDAGYSKLYLMSGRNFENKNPPPYITVLLKDAAAIEKLLTNS